MPDLLLRDRRERDVLLEEGCDPGPLGVPPAEDELVVSDRQQQRCPLAHAPLHGGNQVSPVSPLLRVCGQTAESRLPPGKARLRRRTAVALVARTSMCLFSVFA